LKHWKRPRRTSTENTRLFFDSVPYEGWATCAVFSPDGTTLATAGADATIKLWPAATEEEVIAAGSLNIVEAANQ
jgi:WD40 repeat protein